MKKFSIILFAMVLAWTFVVPVMAETTVDFSGYYRVRGWNKADVSMDGRYQDYDGDALDDDHFVESAHHQQAGNDTAGVDQIAEQQGASYFDHEFTMNFTFNVNDNVKLDGKIDGFSGVLPNNDVDDIGTQDQVIDMENMYMTFDTGIGRFIIGAYGSSGGVGPVAFNDSHDAAIFQYMVPFGNFAFVATYEKGLEDDSDEGNNLQWNDAADDSNRDNRDSADANTADQNELEQNTLNDRYSDGDIDTYALTLAYNNDMVQAGISFGYTRDASHSQDTNSASVDAVNAAKNALIANFGERVSADTMDLTGDETSQDRFFDDDYVTHDFQYNYHQNVYGVDAYVLLTLGNARLNGEIQYGFGERDWADPYFIDADISVWGFFASAGYNFGIVDVELGWAYATGQDWADDFEEQAVTALTTTNEEEGNEPGDADDGDLIYDSADQLLVKSGSTLTARGGLGDLAPLFIMTDNAVWGSLQGDDDLDEPDNSVAGEVERAGVQLVYLTAEVTPMENLTLNFAWGTAWTTADREDPYDPFDNFDEGTSYGWEVDAGFSWVIMDNLTYHFQFAYMDLGSAWDEINREMNQTALPAGLDNEVLNVTERRGHQSNNHNAIDSTYILRHGIQVDF